MTPKPVDTGGVEGGGEFEFRLEWLFDGFTGWAWKDNDGVSHYCVSEDAPFEYVPGAPAGGHGDPPPEQMIPARRSPTPMAALIAATEEAWQDHIAEKPTDSMGDTPQPEKREGPYKPHITESEFYYVYDDDGEIFRREPNGGGVYIGKAGEDDDLLEVLGLLDQEARHFSAQPEGDERLRLAAAGTVWVELPRSDAEFMAGALTKLVTFDEISYTVARACEQALSALGSGEGGKDA